MSLMVMKWPKLEVMLGKDMVQVVDAEDMEDQNGSVTMSSFV